MVKKVVGVVFNRDNPDNSRGCPKTYSYWTDLDLKVGDKVVVFVEQSRFGDFDGTKGYKVVEVVNAEMCSTGASKWVVDKIDVEGFKERIAARQEMARLERMLASRIEEVRRKQVVSELLTGDDEAQGWLKRLSELAEKA